MVSEKIMLRWERVIKGTCDPKFLGHCQSIITKRIEQHDYDIEGRAFRWSNGQLQTLKALIEERLTVLAVIELL